MKLLTLLIKYIRVQPSLGGFYTVLKIKKIYDKLNELNFCNPLIIQEVQKKKLIKLIYHACKNVEFYRHLNICSSLLSKDNNFLYSLELEDILNDYIAKFPITDKKLIKKYGINKFLTQDYRNKKYKKASTSGTTGRPFEFFLDINSIVWSEAILNQRKQWVGYNLGDKTVYLKSFSNPSFLGKLRMYLLKSLIFPVFFENSENYINMLRFIKKFSPKALEGFPYSLYKLSKEVVSYNINLKIPLIFSTGEMLYDYQRDIIKRVFKAKIFEYYGSNEIGSIAFQCKYGNYHISDEHVLVEVIDDNGKRIYDEVGYIVVTDLDNYVMPFIRYKIGDIGMITKEECPCGRKLTVLKKLEGRMQDRIKTAKGNYITATYFTSVFRNIKGVDAFQIIQEKEDEIILKLEKNVNFSPNEVKYMVDTIKKISGLQNVKVQFVDKIPVSPRGKRRVVISKF